MVTEIRPGEPVSAELRRVAAEYGRIAAAALRRRDEDPHKAVHESRKAMRSARGVLRLYREVLGDDGYRERNGLLRHAAHLLSPHRDARVRLETLDSLVAGVDKHRELAPELRARIEEFLRLSTGDLEAAAARAEELVQTFRDSLSEWPGETEDGPKLAGKGLRRAVKRAGKRLDRALSDPTPETLHELRKRSKDVREQLRVLRLLEPERLDDLEDEFDDVSDDLGDARDLHLIASLLEDTAKNWPAARPLIGLLVEEATRRRHDLERSGLKHARKAAGVSAGDLKDLVRERWRPRTQ